MGIVHATRGRRLAPAVIVIILALLALVVAFAMIAQPAAAIDTYVHGTATSCGSCHTSTPRTAANASTAKCITCHTTYALPDATLTCWTCHTPGQDVQPIKTGAPATCTATCHLANGTDHTHNPHPERGACTTCHHVTTDATTPNGSPHHTVKSTAVAATTVSLKVAPTVIKLKKTVKATGIVTPVATLAGVRVALKAERKVGTKWVKAKTASPVVSATGTYSWTYKPLKKGSYRMRASIAATSTYKASKSALKTFKVK